MIIRIIPDVVEIRTPTYHIRTRKVNRRSVVIMGEDQDIIYDPAPPLPPYFSWDNTRLYHERAGVTSQILAGDFTIAAFMFEHINTENIEIFGNPGFPQHLQTHFTGGTEDVDIST